MYFYQSRRQTCACTSSRAFNPLRLGKLSVGLVVKKLSKEQDQRADDCRLPDTNGCVSISREPSKGLRITSSDAETTFVAAEHAGTDNLYKV